MVGTFYAWSIVNGRCALVLDKGHTKGAGCKHGNKRRGMVNNVIEVTARTVYGNVLLYPANDQAKLLANMVNTRTLTHATLHLARGMGFDIRVLGDATLAYTVQESFK